MYRGFDLRLDLNKEDIARFYQVGKALYDSSKAEVGKTLSSFILSDNTLDGSKIQATWFPQINMDIFISHSHKNENIAIALAGWIFQSFGLKSFIDSCIWGYADDLLRMIDNKYCRQKSGIYDYTKRNYSTSHVHMMLSSALSMMIDKTECLFFLNTPSSVKPFDGEERTESPWIYSEILMTQLIEKKTPRRIEIINESYWNAIGDPLIKSEDQRLISKYKIELNHLAKIDVNSLNVWKKEFVQGNALDTLYVLNPSPNK